MAIRNGSNTGTEYEVETPAPAPATGTYPASKSMTVVSVVLVVAGVAVGIYALTVQAGETLTWAGILLALAGAGVEAANLALASSRQASKTQVMMLTSGGEKKDLAPEEQHPWTFAPGSRVTFCEPGTHVHWASTGPINNPNALVTLKQLPQGARAGGGTGFYVEVTP